MSRASHAYFPSLRFTQQVTNNWGTNVTVTKLTLGVSRLAGYKVICYVRWSYFLGLTGKRGDLVKDQDPVAKESPSLTLGCTRSRWLPVGGEGPYVNTSSKC